MSYIEDKDVVYWMNKIMEFGFCNEESELNNLTVNQLKDIGTVIAWELSLMKTKEECPHDNVEEMCIDSAISTCGRCKDCGEIIDTR